MQAMGVVLALLALPFWKSKAPRAWSPAELDELMHDSPWAQMAEGSPAVQVFLATALPIREAEAELARRTGRRPSTVGDDYAEFLREDGGKHLVLAIPYPNWTALANAEDSRRMEQGCLMKIGRKKYKLEGHIPPTPSDPFLRLVYPRLAQPGDKNIVFELYLPGIANPFREVEFRIKDMAYRGKLEM